MTPEEKQLASEWSQFNEAYKKAQKLSRSRSKHNRVEGLQLFAKLRQYRLELKKRGQQLKEAKTLDNGTEAGFSAWWTSESEGRRRTQRQRKQ